MPSSHPRGAAMDRLLSAMKAAAEPARLRLLVLCAHADLTVSDLIVILGQSQPRLSRHLKLLTEAGLLDRTREGSWAYFRLAHAGAPRSAERRVGKAGGSTCRSRWSPSL